MNAITLNLRISPAAERHIVEEHGVRFEECEEVAALGLMYQVQGGRFLLLGKTSTARMLRIVLRGDVDQTWWVVTAMEMGTKDKRFWRRHMEG